MAYSIDVDKAFFAGVSQSLNTTYHSPAVLYVLSLYIPPSHRSNCFLIYSGDRLRIVNYTVAGGSRAKTARCEVGFRRTFAFPVSLTVNGLSRFGTQRNIGS